MRPAVETRFSLEATRPKSAEIDRLRGILRPGTPIYLSSVAGKNPADLVTFAAMIRAAGFEPVPHIAARRIASAQSLKDFLARLHGEANVTRALVIAGDRDEVAGPYADAQSVIQSGALRAAGLTEIGISGYPEGHPSIARDKLDAAMQAKIAAAVAGGLAVHIVSQFCFDPPRIIAWLRALRARGISQPVRVGLVGPTHLSALIRFAKRCGVQASLRGLIRSGAFWSFLRPPHPGAALRALRRTEGLGEVRPHFFSFGGIPETARYAVKHADSHSAQN